jgi:sec-independent protein translocase protein TatB
VFDISFVELITIGAVALVVLGPERLPAAARTVGTLVRRARASWQSVRDEFEREMAASGVRQSVDALRGEADALARQVEGAPRNTPGAADPGGRERRPPHD